MLVALPFGVCAQETDEAVQDDVRRKYEYFFHEANRQRLLENYDAAVELYEYCLTLNPDADVVLYELSKFMNYLQKDSLAEAYLKRAVELAPDNYWYANALVMAYVSDGKIVEALEVAETLSEKFPKKSDVLLMLVDLYTRTEDYANVIKTLERLEVKEGKSERISMEKFRVFSIMKDEKRAYEEIVSLSEEYPYDMRYRVLLGDMYLDNGHPDKALEVYRKLEQEDSTNINLMLSLASYYEKQKQDSLYNRQVERLVMNGKLDNNTRVQILTSMVYNNLTNHKDSTKLLSLFDKVLTLPQENAAMAELCARYMVTLKMPAEAVTPVLRRIVALDPENRMARSQLLSYAIHTNDADSVIAVSKPAVDYGIDDPMFYYFLGVAYAQKDKPSDVIDVLKQGLTKAKPETSIDIIANSYTLIGDMYHKLGDDTKAFEAYDSCLIYSPNDEGALNNYAYFLSLRNQDLERAERMSAKAVSIEPDNANYVDTYAWILFMMKRYDEAKTHIDKALEILGDSVTADDANIIEHAGDIYYMAGEHDEALLLWARAFDLGAHESGVLLKKIKKKKYIRK